MTIFKIKTRQNPYVILDKTFLTQKNLSWKAKGLLAYLLSLPSDWEIHVNELVKHAKDGRDAVYTAIRELKQAGYIIQTTKRSNTGRFSKHDYGVFELPQLRDCYTSNNNVTQPSFPKNSKINSGDVNSIYPFSQIKQTERATGQTTVEVTNNAKQLLPDIKKQYKPPTTTPVFNQFKQQIEDTIINDGQLTPMQIQHVRRLAMQVNHQFQGKSTEVLIDEITHTLLNKKSFSAAGCNFARKLNTIAKVIRENRWYSPICQTLKQVRAPVEPRDALLDELHQLHGHATHWKRLMTYCKVQDRTNAFRQFQHELKLVQARIKTLALQRKGD